MHEGRDGGGDGRRSEDLQGVLDHAPDAFVAMDVQGCITEWNVRAERLFGWSRDEALGRTVAGLLIPEELRDAHRAGLATYLATQAAPILNRSVEVDALTKDGGSVPVELTIAAVGTRDGVAFNAFLRDIRERRAHERALRDAEERFRRAFDEAPIGMALVALDGRFVRVNAALCEILGRDAETLMEQRFQDITHPDDLRADESLVAEMLAGERPGYELEKRYVHAAGHPVWVQLNVSAVLDDAGRPDYFVSQVQDVTTRKGLEERLESLARQDHLTGLLNRRGFEEALDRQLSLARRAQGTGAVLILDLDGFKRVNDRFGHQAGDDVLRATAAVFRDRLRETDVLGRLGGDEFAIVLPDVTAQGALTVVEALQSAIGQPVLSITGEPLHVSLSVGWAIYDGETTARDVLAAADTEMYAAKRRASH